MSPASANTLVTFSLDGVELHGNGVGSANFPATGDFTLDLTTGSITAVNIFSYNAFTDPSQTLFSNSNASFSFLLDNGLSGLRLDINLAVALTPSSVAGSPSFPIASGTEFFLSLFCPGTVCNTASIASGSLDVTSVVTPVPAALPLFATGLGVIGLLTQRRKRKIAAA